MTALYEQRFLLALLLTIAVETGVLFAVLRGLFQVARDEAPTARVLLCGFVCSFATLPYLWFVLPAFIHSRTQLIVVGEIGVFLVEAAVISAVLRQGLRRAVIASLLCNLASIVAGEVYKAVWPS